MNSNLARWTLASIAKHFAAIVAGLSLEYFVEGVDERNTDNMTHEHAELRVNGPLVRELSHDCWQVYVDVNVLLTDYMKMSNENAYALSTWGGTILNVMFDPIPVYKYGDGVEDDDSLVGCLTVRRGVNEPVRLLYFGQTSKTDRIRQAAVDGRFEMLLST